METQKKNYVLPIAMMFALFAMISFVTGLQNPMGIIVKNQFGASNFMSQLGNAANFIAYAFMGLPAGLMLQRIGYKKTALAAVAVGFIGVGISYLSGLMSSFSVYLIGAFVSGFSMCMLNTVVNPMLNTLGGGGNRGNQLVQFGGSLNSLAATIVPVLVGYLMGNAAQATISNAAPALFIAMGIFALAFVVMLVMEIPEPFALTNEKSAEKNEHSALSFRHFVLGTVAIFVYVGVEVGIPNFANLFMTTDLGIDTTVAGSVVGTYWFLMLIGRFGHLHGDGLRRRHPAPDPGSGGRPRGLHDVLLGGLRRCALHPLLRTRRTQERQYRHQGGLNRLPIGKTGRPLRGPARCDCRKAPVTSPRAA